MYHQFQNMNPASWMDNLKGGTSVQILFFNDFYSMAKTIIEKIIITFKILKDVINKYIINC